MSKGLDPRWDGSTISRSNRRMSRLTNGAPARVFHQGPQQLNAARMTVCSFAVRTLAQTTLQLDSGRSPCSDIDDTTSSTFPVAFINTKWTGPGLLSRAIDTCRPSEYCMNVQYLPRKSKWTRLSVSRRWKVDE